MGRPVQFLVAIAALVVIAAGSTFLWDREQARREALAREQAVKDAKSAASLRDCRELVEAIDSGDVSLAKRRYGSRYEGIIETCRILISVSD